MVAYSDPIIPYLDIGDIHLQSIRLDRKALTGFDAVVIATDHTAVDYALVRRHARKIFDVRNVYPGVQDKKIFRL